MQQVRLEGFQAMDNGQWAIRFVSSDRDAFLSVKDVIKQWGRPFASWEPDLFNGRGGWLIDTCVLKSVATSFSNLYQMIDDAARRVLQRPSETLSTRPIPFYTMLGLPATRRATGEELQQDYRTRSQLYHPDTGGAHQLMVALNYAYEQAKGHSA